MFAIARFMRAVACQNGSSARREAGARDPVPSPHRVRRPGLQGGTTADFDLPRSTPLVSPRLRRTAPSRRYDARSRQALCPVRPKAQQSLHLTRDAWRGSALAQQASGIRQIACLACEDAERVQCVGGVDRRRARCQEQPGAVLRPVWAGHRRKRQCRRLDRLVRSLPSATLPMLGPGPVWVDASGVDMAASPRPLPIPICSRGSSAGLKTMPVHARVGRSSCR